MDPLAPTITYASIRIAPTESQYPQGIDTTNVTVKYNVIAGCPGARAINDWNTSPGMRTASGPGASNNTFYADKDSIDITGTPATGFLQNVAVDNNLIVATPFTAPGGATAMLDQVSADAVAGTDGQGSFPPFFSACQVKAEWFQNKNGTAVGADVSTFASAGMLAPLASGSCSATATDAGCPEDAGDEACDASPPSDAEPESDASAPSDAGPDGSASGETSGQMGNGGGCSASGAVAAGALGGGLIPFLGMIAVGLVRRRRTRVLVRRGPRHSRAPSKAGKQDERLSRGLGR